MISYLQGKSSITNYKTNNYKEVAIIESVSYYFRILLMLLAIIYPMYRWIEIVLLLFKGESVLGSVTHLAQTKGKYGFNIFKPKYYYVVMYEYRDIENGELLEGRMKRLYKSKHYQKGDTIAIRYSTMKRGKKVKSVCLTAKELIYTELLLFIVGILLFITNFT